LFPHARVAVRRRTGLGLKIGRAPSAAGVAANQHTQHRATFHQATKNPTSPSFLCRPLRGLNNTTTHHFTPQRSLRAARAPLLSQRPLRAALRFAIGAHKVEPLRGSHRRKKHRTPFAVAVVEPFPPFSSPQIIALSDPGGKVTSDNSHYVQYLTFRSILTTEFALFVHCSTEYFQVLVSCE
jgi:hypothetical protein